MKMKSIISASILSADFSNLTREIMDCEEAGVDWIHIDVMDGHFVPNLTMGPFILKACRSITDLPLDCHLMVEKPETLVQSFAESGARYITIHPECNPNIHRTLQQIRNLGCIPGIALNPGTPVSSIKSLIASIDLILVMTVNPGFSGQSFIPEMLDKIRQVKHLIDQQERYIHLEVDGGINSETISEAHKAGADTFVSATSIFSHPDGIGAGVEALRNSIH
jgi:ribulose-phosphate 3-epimerase